MNARPGEDVGATIRRLLGQVAPEAGLDTIDPSADLRETLDIDSFDFLNVLVAIDRELGVSIPETDYGKVSTFQSLVDYINQARRGTP